VFLNKSGKEILAGLVPENTFPTNPQIEKMFLSGLERRGEEVRVDVVGLTAAPFLARIFALSATHVCVHMHNPTHPFVMVNGKPEETSLDGQDAARAPPLLAVEDAASIVSGYAEPGRKRMRSGAPEEHKVIYSSMDYLVGGSNVNLPKVRTASLYDDLAVPVLQWDRQGKCLTANGPMLNMLELPDATTLDIDTCFQPESAARIRASIQEIERGRTMNFLVTTHQQLQLSVNLSCSHVTSLLIAVMILQQEPKDLDDPV
jgi:hypothetical protein